MQSTNRLDIIKNVKTNQLDINKNVKEGLQVQQGPNLAHRNYRSEQKGGSSKRIVKKAARNI